MKFRKMYSNGSSITENLKHTEGTKSNTSLYYPTSYASSKKLTSLRKRNSQFVRLDFGNINRVASKQSSNSFKKHPTLKSIKEHPSEDKYLNVLMNTKNLSKSS